MTANRWAAAGVTAISLAVGARAEAQGIQPLTEQTLAAAKALAAGPSNNGLAQLPGVTFGPRESSAKPTDLLFLNNPIVRRQALLDSPDYRVGPTERRDFLAVVQTVPFNFALVSPLARAAYAFAEAARRYQDAPSLTLGDLNSGLVVVHVEPSDTITKADAIEDVVIRRAGAVLRASKKDVRPITVRTLGGASAELSQGDFTFPFETFSPTEPITLVLIGRKGNFEWSVSRQELDGMK